MIDMLSKERTLLVINPAARSGKVALLWQEQEAPVLGLLGRENTEVFFTHSEDHGQRAVRAALQAGVRKVVVIGGDGTVSEAVQGFFENGKSIAPEATLAVLPSGRGDDFLKSVLNTRFLSSQAAWNHGIEILKKGATQSIDVGHIQWLGPNGAEVKPDHLADRADTRPMVGKKYFINIASFAFPGLVVQRVQSKTGFWSTSFVGRSAWTYAMQAVLANSAYVPLPIQVKVDGEIFYEGKIHSGYILNGRYNAGGICWDRTARLDDGYFNVLILDGSNAWKSFKGSSHLALSSGKVPPPEDSSRTGIYSKKGKCIEVMLQGDITKPHPLFEVDGDLPEPDQAVGARFTILPQSLSVVSG